MINHSNRGDSGPWYRDLGRLLVRADRFQQEFERLEESFDKDARYASQFESYSELAISRLIFESNLIEDSGMPTLGETRTLLNEHPELHFKNRTEHELNRVRKSLEAFTYLDRVFSGKRRPEREVHQHQIAITQALIFSTEHRMLLARDALHELQRPVGTSELSSVPLFTEARIQRLHAILSAGLLRDAGMYRTTDVSIGLELAFPAAANLPSAMKTFVNDANRTIHEVIRKENDRYHAAARISHQFVSIHPFSDFNGRVSRLLMNMVLDCFDLPFLVALRGDKKGKQRYRAALKHADMGKLDRLTALVAMQVVESFEELDQLLRRSGLKPLSEDLEAQG